MPSWVQSGPFALVYVFLLVVVFFRAQATYWLGRAVAAGAVHSRLARYVEGPRVRRATEVIDRWGLPVIPLSFLTIGFQTAVNAGAGLLRIRWTRYTVAMIPGCLLWAAIYAAGGLAAFEAGVALAARSPWALAGAVVAVAVLVTAMVVVARRRRAAARAVEALTERATHPGRSQDDSRH
ncbi:DedA family protein [Actinotalea sp.]|uniref:DedA family protein n=1 Tax=Actinotalea sp. TaxID=1872145 RepID=UPI003562FADD